MNAEARHLFVYGTLRKHLAHEMHGVLKRAARLVGEATVQGTLYDLGAYPALVVAGAGEGRVTGELYALDPGGVQTVLESLDAYEGCTAADPEPHEYRREVLSVRIAEGSEIAAWTYLLNRSHAGLTPVPGGDYVAWIRSRA